MDFALMLETSARRYPSKTAVVSDQGRFSYQELEELGNQFAHSMLKMNVSRQDRVGILSKNSYYYLALLFGCAKAEAAAVCYNWRMSEEELKQLIYESDVDIIYISSFFAEMFQEAIQETKGRYRFVVMDDKEYLSSLATLPNTPPKRATRGDDVLFIIYTCGTTGISKGVMLTHKNVVTHAMAQAIDTEHGVESIFISTNPFFHVSASSVFVSVLVGGTVVLPTSFTPEEMAKLIEQEKATMLGAPPTILALMLRSADTRKYDLSSLRNIVYGSAPMPFTLLKKVLKEFPECRFVQLYGMAEMSPTICTLVPEDHLVLDLDEAPRRLESVGKPSIGSYVRIVNDKGEDVEAGETGEIICKGDHLMKGYYDDPEGTAEKIKDGWYFTGDLAEYDEEGYIYIRGRKSEMIISGGENIMLTDIEACIFELNSVEDVAVVGKGDEVWGEVPVAFVVKKEEAVLTEEEIINYCHENLGSYRKPTSVIFTEELPKNASGKVQKYLLSEQLKQ